MFEITIKALKRFKELIESLECECDEYHGYTCPLHNDKKLCDQAIKELHQLPRPEAVATIRSKER